MWVATLYEVSKNAMKKAVGLKWWLHLLWGVGTWYKKNRLPIIFRNWVNLISSFPSFFLTSNKSSAISWTSICLKLWFHLFWYMDRWLTTQLVELINFILLNRWFNCELRCLIFGLGPKFSLIVTIKIYCVQERNFYRMYNFFFFT